MSAAAAIYLIAGLATLGVIIRPWDLNEGIWPAAAAVLLVALGLLPTNAALQGVARGTNVYLFLIGMMLLADVARVEGLFDWLAGHTVRAARGSAARLFDMVFVVAVAVTVGLSNDATAVVLTPAIAAVTAAAGVQQPLPYLFICAFVANAASFVLPISNPANFVIYSTHMPALLEWLPYFALPSFLSIGATYAVLRLTQDRALREAVTTRLPIRELTLGGRTAGYGILVAAAVLVTASALDRPLGLPTCLAGVATVAVVAVRERKVPTRVVRELSWGILPLVAGLFVLVEALDRIGVVSALSQLLQRAVAVSPVHAAWASAGAVTLASNIANNLPVGLFAGTTISAARAPTIVTSAVLIAVDVGPNLSVTGSLATLLWLAALRRDGHEIDAWTFLKLGILVMPPALVLALAALLVPR